MLPYIAMMLAFLKTRIKQPEHHRPYKIPGGLNVARLVATLCMSVLTIAIILFIYVPNEGIQWTILFGVIITLLVGEVAIKSSEK